MRAREIMTSPVFVIEQNASPENAAELMTATSVTALPVVDSSGVLVGMVGEGDLLWHRIPPELTVDPHRYPGTDSTHRPVMVVDVMSRHPVTTTPEADVAGVAEAMLEHDVRSMPVLDGNAIVGIISRRDILRAMVRGDDTLRKEAQHRLDEYADGKRLWTVSVSRGVATVMGSYTDSGQRAVVEILVRTVPGIAEVRSG